MSAFLPEGPKGLFTDPEHPRLHQRPLSPAEERTRWEVHAAKWRARELAEAVFGSVSGSALIGIRPDGPFRGLVQLEVPFRDLGLHRRREEIFLAAVDRDPVLSSIPLVYVFAPDVS